MAIKKENECVLSQDCLMLVLSDALCNATVRFGHGMDDLETGFSGCCCCCCFFLLENASYETRKDASKPESTG